MNKETQITAERKAQLDKWWQVSFNSFDAPHVSIMEYAINKFPEIIDGLPSIAFVERNVIPALAECYYKCPAKCPMQFRAWCYAKIDAIPKKIATASKPPRKNEKPFPKYEEYGGNCYVPVQDAKGERHTWIFPSDFLQHARKLWPGAHVRHMPDGRPYLSHKKAIREVDGMRQVDMPLHHVFLQFKYPLLRKGDIICKPRNRDFLDWRGDNLYVPAVHGKHISDKERAYQLQQAVRESSLKQVYVGGDDGTDGYYATVSTGIDPALIRQWESVLAEDIVLRDYMDVHNRGEMPEE